jgi:hypothetical protein
MSAVQTVSTPIMALQYNGAIVQTIPAAIVQTMRGGTMSGEVVTLTTSGWPLRSHVGFFGCGGRAPSGRSLSGLKACGDPYEVKPLAYRANGFGNAMTAQSR